MQRTKYIAEGKEDNLAQQVLSKYIPYWPLFILAVILGGIVAIVYLKFQIPIYEASATLIIKDEKKGTEESKLMESLDPISSKKIVENETEIIQSRRLMKDVAEKLGLYAPINQVGKYTHSSAYTSFPIRILSPYPDSIIGTQKDEKISISFDTTNNQVVLNNKDRYPLDKVIRTKNGELIFQINRDYVSPKSPPNEFYFTLSPPANIAAGFLGGLKAEPASKLSSVVILTYRDQVPKRAEDILNQLITSYRQFEINEKEALAKNTLKFVEERLKLVAHDLDSIQQKEMLYKSDRGAVNIGTQGQLYLQNVSANDQKLSEVNTQLSVLNQVEKFVVNKGNKDGIVPSTLGMSDPMLSGLMDKLYSAELEYSKLKKTTGENFPQMVALKDEIEKIRPNILQNIQSQKQSLLAAKQNIFSTNSGYNSILQTVPQKERELLDITREQQIKSNIYSFLLQKKEESQIAYASTMSNNRVVDFAQSRSGPVSPKRMLIIAISVFIFLGMCLAFITVRESFTGKILYRQEIESRTDIPVIGEIAFDKSNNDIVIEKGRRSYIAEEFRKLRISLSFLGIDSNHRNILVTSSISGEGKSFIAANLAISLALTGKKVVLVDMDLNRPTLNKILSVQRKDGVTEYLEGKRTADEIIKSIPDHDNLFFISAGTLPEDPSELLSNARAKELINYLNSEFDYVVIDTSPMVLVTDGYLLTDLCDATLYVIRHKYTPKIIVKRIDQNKHINPIHNPAIIFNGVKARGFFTNNYGYGYNYVYGKDVYESNNKSTESKPILKA